MGLGYVSLGGVRVRLVSSRFVVAYLLPKI